MGEARAPRGRPSATTQLWVAAAASGHSLVQPPPGRLARELDPHLTLLLLPTLVGAPEPEGTEAGFRQAQAALSPVTQAGATGFDT